MTEDTDRLISIEDIPQSSVGAPCPLVYATEHEVYVTYFLNDPDPAWDGSTVKVVSTDTSDEPSIIVKFERVLAHYFGVPSDECIGGHPLHKKGLGPYSYYEVLNSSWIDKHEKMNRVHPYHQKDFYDSYRHFIFTFHDTTFEVIAENFTVTQGAGSLVRNIKSVL